MKILLQRLPILSILLIHILPSIHCSHGNLRALVNGEMVEQMNAEVLRGMARKIPIGIDLSGDAPVGIWALQSSWVPIRKTYIVDGQHYETHRIGAILDGGVMVLRDDHRSVKRNVQFYIEEDGRKVVSITDFFDSPDGMEREITELMRLPEEPFYEPLRRIPLDIDLLEKCPDWVNVQRHPPSGLVTYTIRPEVKNRAIIGMVRYGGQNVEDGPNDEVIERTVILHTDGESSEILVTSHMKDGSTVNAEYSFREGNIIHMGTEVIAL